MEYISTRGQSPTLNFEDVLLTGLAPDGGLYVPRQLPQFTVQDIRTWATLSYTDLAFIIMQSFVGDCLMADELKAIIEASYRDFRHQAIAPLVQLDQNLWVLELFQGPTLAFKDFALQILGRLLETVLERRGQRAIIMGATSGDTGSAAIHACQHCEHIDLFMLHPNQRVSDVQRRQMTTVLSHRIHNLAIEGSFDDCQTMVKACFNDRHFPNDDRQLVAVNSINWARIMAQVVYYFYAALALGAPYRPVSFSVPTGNFGNIYAGYLAANMGLPIEQLIVATNSNDILHRCLSRNDCTTHDSVHTLSPSMDIVVSSNFERLLFDAYQRDGAAITHLMTRFQTEPVTLNADAWRTIKQRFTSHSVSDSATLQTMHDIYQRTGYTLDPHSAIGVASAQAIHPHNDIPVVSLATAHPAKFPGAAKQAGYPEPTLPPSMADLFTRDERFEVLPCDVDQLQQVVNQHQPA